MTVYKAPRQVWEALAAAAPGKERAAILAEGQNRSLILNSGSFVIFTNGEVNPQGTTAQEQLSPIRVLQTQRLRTLPDGQVIMDGKGTFGGLSERSMREEKLTAKISLSLADLEGKTVDEFLSGPFRKELEKLVALRDDLSLDSQSHVTLTTDLSEIALTTAARESMEEMVEIMALRDIAGKLHIDQEPLRVIFKKAALTAIPLQQVRDDNFIINIWSGDLNKPAFAITPFGHLATLDESAFSQIAIPGSEKMHEGLKIFADPEARPQLTGREILGVEGAPLFECLKRWGKPTTGGSRDLSSDYRYPHEWMGVWRAAQSTLSLDRKAGGGMGYRQAGMVNLIKEVQHSIINDAEAAGISPYNVNIFGALVQMNGGSVRDPQDVSRFDQDFELPAGSFVEMHLAAEDVMRSRGYRPTTRLVSYLDGETAVDFMAERTPS